MTTKMNMTFFIGNKVLNIFLINNFFENSNIFAENRSQNLTKYSKNFYWKYFRFYL